MDKILLLLGCVALFGLAQGYTLRDIVRERALRRYEAYDTNDYLATKYQREYDALRARALRTLREFHLRHMFDANFRMDEECKDENEHCADSVQANGGESYCRDPDENIQNYVKAHCRLSCGFCEGSSPTKPPHPGGSRACENVLERYYPGSCSTYKKFCNADDAVKFYLNRYCYATCHDDECSQKRRMYPYY